MSNLGGASDDDEFWWIFGFSGRWTTRHSIKVVCGLVGTESLPLGKDLVLTPFVANNRYVSSEWEILPSTTTTVP